MCVAAADELYVPLSSFSQSYKKYEATAIDSKAIVSSFSHDSKNQVNIATKASVAALCIFTYNTITFGHLQMCQKWKRKARGFYSKFT